MFSLESITKMNSKAETFKHRRRAKALNRPGGHAKDAEKGRVKYRVYPQPKVFPAPYNPEELKKTGLTRLGSQPLADVILFNDPELDGTDFAHPAWWRGNEAGCLGTAERFQKILDGKDDGHGVISHPKLESVRRQILRLKKTVDRLRKRK